MSDQQSEQSQHDVRLREREEGLVLEVGDTEILLHTSLELEPEDDRRAIGEHVSLAGEVDCDGDNGCWFQYSPEDGDYWPSVVVQPEVL